MADNSTITRPRVPIDERGRVRQLAASIDPQASGFSEELSAVLDAFERRESRVERLEEEVRELREKTGEVDPDAPEWFQKAMKNRQQGQDSILGREDRQNPFE